MTYRFGSFTLDLERGALLAADGKEISLRPKSFALLQFLVENAGRLLSREAIMEAVWPNIFVTEDNVSQCVHDVRRALSSEAHRMLRTVPRRGYLFASDVIGVQQQVNSPPSNNSLDEHVRSDYSPAPGGTAITTKGQRIPGDHETEPLLPTVMFSRLRLSLVVLPFANLGGNANEDCLADAITEDLTTDLSRLPGLVVIARNSAFTYRGKPIDVKRIGEELGVRYALKGSVRRVGNSLRVNVQLVSTETGAHLWANRFDVEASTFSIGQDEIVPRVATALGMEMVQVEAAHSERERSANPDASDLILQARALQNQPNNLQRDSTAQVFYERALQLDPSSAWTMARLAHTLISLRLNRGYWLDGSDIGRVEKLVADAQAIAPTAEVTLAVTAWFHEVKGHYQEAIATAQRLIEVNPNNSAGYVSLARNRIYTGQAAQAIPLLTKALQLNPRDPGLFDRYWRMGYALLMIGHYEQSIVWQQRSLAAFPDAPAAIRCSRYRMMSVAYALSGQMDSGRRAIAEAKRIFPFWTIRSFFPEDATSEARVSQVQRFQEGLRMVGARDHADENADFGVLSNGELHAIVNGYTATTAPGARAIRTTELVHLLAERKPIIVDFGGNSWGRSIPGAIALQDVGVGASSSDGTQDRLRLKMRELTKNDLSSPVVAVGWNSENFSGRNLALRLVALGYTEVYWYRGGREAWEVADLPETDLVMQEW